MVGEIRSSGIVSGINMKSVLKKSLKGGQQKIQRLKTDIKEVDKKKSSFQGITSELSSMRSIASTLSSPRTFSDTSVSSSDSSTLSASGSQVNTTGSFDFTPKQTAQTHLMFSTGFSEKTEKPGAGDISFELGDGHLDRTTSVKLMNEGQGIDRGRIRIVNEGTGDQATVDLTDAAHGGDVVERINESSGVDVEVEAEGDRFIVNNNTGNNISIETVGSGSTAEDLGIAIDNKGGSTLVGDKVLNLGTSTKLDQLNDGLGIRRKTAQKDFTITTRDGSTVTVGLEKGDETVQDVLDKINENANNDTDDDGTPEVVEASFSKETNSFVLKDLTSDDGTSTLQVSAENNSNAAVDLGFLVNPGGALDTISTDGSGGSVDPELNGSRDSGGDTLVGKRVIGGINSRLRSTINGGARKFDEQGNEVNDFDGVEGGDATIQARDGSSTTVNFDARNSTTISSVETDGNGNRVRMELNDLTGITEGSRIRVSNGSTTETKVVTDIADPDNDSTDEVIFEGQALDGTFGSGDGVHTEKESVNDVFNAVNNNNTLSGKVKLDLNREKNGVTLTDTTDSTANDLVFDSNTGLVGDDLDIDTDSNDGGAGVSSSTVSGSDRDAQHIGLRTKLDSLNGGEGVDKGGFVVEDTNGNSFSVDLSQSDDTRIQDVITEINNASTANGSALEARVNDAGDGIVLEDTNPGSGTVSVSEVGGTTAEDLNIQGEAPDSSPETLNGSFEFNVDVSSDDTLEDIVDKINDSDAEVKANLVDDGSDINPIHISLESQRSGLPGRITSDSSVPGLNFNTTAAPQNARLLFGSDGSLFTRNKNNFNDIVEGLDVTVNSRSDSPVTVNVDRNFEKIQKKTQEFVDQFNKTIQKIKDATKFDPDTFEGGPLLGEPNVQSAKQEITRAVTRQVAGISSQKINVASEIGITLKNNGKINFDSGKFSNALNSNFEQVEEFFTRRRRLDLDTKLSDFNNGRGVDTGNGSDLKIFREDGQVFEVDLSSADSVSDLTRTINTHSGNNDNIDFDLGSQSRRLTVESLSGNRTNDADDIQDGGTTLVDNDLGSTGNSSTEFTEESLEGARITNPDTGDQATVEDFNGTDTLTLSEDIGLSATDNFELSAKVGIRSSDTTRTASSLGLDKRGDPGDSFVEGNIVSLEDDPGFASRKVDTIVSIVRDSNGLLSQEIDQLEDEKEDIKDQIKEQTERIQNRRERLIKRFSRMEKFIAQQQSAKKRLAGLGGGGGGGAGGGLSQLLGGV